MILFLRRVVRDFLNNIFLNIVTIITIAVAVAIFSAFMLFFMNAEALIRAWMKDMRIMVYLESETSEAAATALQARIREIADVRKVVYVPKTAAMERFREQLGQQASLLDNLKENPLPDALEVYVTETPRNWEKIAPVAGKIEALDHVEAVEFGRQWLDRVVYILNLFRLTGYAVGGLFLIAVIFFIANTIRLVLYSRRDEIQIMRLVGASDGFIKDPFYVQALILGGLGGALGLGILNAGFRLLQSSSAGETIATVFRLRFFSPEMVAGILFASLLVGWIGCFISLHQFFK